MNRSPALEGALARLDPEQAQAAAWMPADGNLRIDAPAGAGKSSLLVALAARLIQDGAVLPHRFVLVTFANRASRTLKTRLGALLPPAYAQAVRIGTFHSLALRHLRTNAATKAQWEARMCLDSGKDRAPHLPSSSLLWRQVVEWGRIAGSGKASLKLAKTYEDVQRYQRFGDLVRSYGYDDGDALAGDDALSKAAPPDFDEAWALFREAKTALHAWDFADSLSGYRRALERGEDSADVVFVDEAQDCDRLQIGIMQKLAENAGGKLVIIGDGCQAIHRWRGAYATLFQHADVLLAAKTLPIVTNYRSVPPIVAFCNKLVAGKAWKIGPPARAFRIDTDADPRLARRGELPAPPPEKADRYAAAKALRDRATTTGERTAAEAAMARIAGGEAPSIAIDAVRHAEVYQDVAERIKLALGKGVAPGAFAILSRTNAQLSDFQAALAELDIPYTIVGGDSLFETTEAKTVLSYCLLSERDAYGSLEVAIHQPKRYLPKNFVDQVRSYRSTGLSFVAAIRKAGSGLEKGGPRNAHALADCIEELRGAGWENVPALVGKLVEKPPEKVRKAREGESPDEDRPAFYAAALRVAARRSSPTDFLDYAQRIINMSMSSSEDDDQPGGGKRVILSTSHKMKGGEAAHVFVYSEAGTFPSKRAASTELDDELRLFYVACSRARDRLTFAYRDEPCEYLLRYGKDILAELGALGPAL